MTLKTPTELYADADLALGNARKILSELRHRVQAAETRENDARQRVTYWAAKASEKDFEIRRLKRSRAALRAVITKLKGERV